MQLSNLSAPKILHAAKRVLQTRKFRLKNLLCVVEYVSGETTEIGRGVGKGLFVATVFANRMFNCSCRQLIPSHHRILTTDSLFVGITAVASCHAFQKSSSQLNVYNCCYVHYSLTVIVMKCHATQYILPIYLSVLHYNSVDIRFLKMLVLRTYERKWWMCYKQMRFIAYGQ